MVNDDAIKKALAEEFGKLGLTVEKIGDLKLVDGVPHVSHWSIRGDGDHPPLFQALEMAWDAVRRRML